MTDLSALDTARAHHADVYAQRRLPESAALVTLFHAPPPPRPDRASRRHKPLPTASCLRKISAYNGGFRNTDDDHDAQRVDPAREPYGAARFAKKRLSFADQHGGQLVLEREFRAWDAPIYCNTTIAHSLPSLYQDQDQQNRWGYGSSTMMERLLRGVLGSGGRSSEEEKSGWSQPELLSLCVLSCSVVGYVALNYARITHPK